MASVYPKPPPPPRFNHTVKVVAATAQRLIDTSREEQDRIGGIATDEATFNNVLRPLAELENEVQLESYITFYQHVSADKELRDASSEAEKKLREFWIESSMREDLYKLVAAVHKSNEASVLNISAESKRYLEKSYKDYIRNGLALGREERARFKSIKKELSLLQIDFSKCLGEEDGGIWFAPEELKGVPEDVVSGLDQGSGENEGKLRLTFKYPDYFPTMKNCIVPETRKAMFLGNENKCNSNVELFRKAIALRDENARLLGFKSHAEFRLDDKMAKTPKNVLDFLGDLRDKLKSGGEREKAVLSALKEDELEELRLENDGRYYLWDQSYYNRLLIEKKYNVNQQEIAEYFPLTSTINGMLKIFEELFGLEFVEETGGDKQVWHEDTKQFRVYNERTSDGGEQAFVGWFYMDLHPRPGKYGHAANFNIQPGFTDRSGKRRYPATALVCNFSKPTRDKPSLLKHDEVVTLFHELGHGIHDLVAITEYSRFHGTSVVGDFVEAPSQMLEHWCWNISELTRLSSHYKTEEKLPENLARNLVSTKNVNAALFNLRQLHFGLFDMRVHHLASHTEASDLDTSIEYNKMRTEITKLDPPQGVEMDFAHGEATFGHLMGGYDAGYYGYLYSQVFSADMFYSAFKAGPMNEKEGRRYRHTILEKGGSCEEMDILKEFLGREPNSDAFFEDLGLKS